MSARDLVAIQGEEGSNSAVAARALLGDVGLLPCASFRAAFAALDGAEVARGVLPVENTTAGIVQEVWDRLLGLVPGAPPLCALGEARVRISFVAACLPGAEARVRRILAHPVAAAQCGRWLAASGLDVVPCHDTAGAARLVRESGDETLSALCPPSAARHFELTSFARDCGDADPTFTRFLLVQHGDAQPGDDDDRALVALRLPDEPGALVRALLSFSTRSLNLCALHSRAVPGSPGQYAFLLEVEAGARHRHFASTLEELRRAGCDARVVGSFRAPSWPGEGRLATSSTR